jgi:putative Holliday junction resolvase
LLRPGRRLAIDVGKARIGLAITDIHAILASPLTTVQRVESVVDSVDAVLQEAAVAGEIFEIYVGVPVNLRGESTLSTEDSLIFAEALRANTKVQVRLLDERLTTAMANSQLKQVGKSQKDARSTIDQMAAVAILEFALSVESNTGNEPGLSIEEWRAKYE